ncbi:hypothetical protein LJC57_05810 [Parabacteroides sp. OttesenSCG-928-G07]|nr:hypothetical protein [Parabacteroides sp. OttesenSCG-928-G21]MDL2278090.1 hypothetical protein [Parabacteroides sp. OttesenSCG-928-G07]
MLDYNDLINVIVMTAPMIVSFVCALMIGLTLKEKVRLLEQDLKFTLVFYFFSMGLCWLGLLFKQYNINSYIFIQSGLTFFYFSIVIFFYNYVYVLTRIKESEHFSNFHYLFPFLLTMIIVFWSFFIPRELYEPFFLQNEIPSGRHRYYFLFLEIKMPVGLVFNAIYMALSFHRLYRYRHAQKKELTVVVDYSTEKLQRILHFAIVISIMPLILIVGHFNWHVALLPLIISIIALIYQQVTLAVYIIKQDYQLVPVRKVLRKKEENAEPHLLKREPVIVLPTLPGFVGKLEKESFEAYIQIHKPYLCSTFKITDLTEPLQINRTTLSTFINQQFEVNFSRYMNDWRLRELKELQGYLPYSKMTLRELLPLVGFGSYRSYSRAKNAILIPHIMPEDDNNQVNVDTTIKQNANDVAGS